MTAVAETLDIDRSDVRTIVGNGFKLGLITTLYVVGFALVSRGISGVTETVVQSVLILIAGTVVAFYPAIVVKARTIDGIAWGMLVAVLGATFFTVFDTAILRPLDLYHWTWDAIGGGSGFWYIPVWWMVSAFLSGLGGILVANKSDGDDTATLGSLFPRTAVFALIVFAVVVGTDLLPAASAVVALAFSAGLMVDAIVSSIQNRE